MNLQIFSQYWYGEIWPSNLILIWRETLSIIRNFLQIQSLNKLVNTPFYEDLISDVNLKNFDFFLKKRKFRISSKLISIQVYTNLKAFSNQGGFSLLDIFSLFLLEKSMGKNKMKLLRVSKSPLQERKCSVSVSTFGSRCWIYNWVCISLPNNLKVVSIEILSKFYYSPKLGWKCIYINLSFCQAFLELRNQIYFQGQQSFGFGSFSNKKVWDFLSSWSACCFDLSRALSWPFEEKDQWTRS